MRRPSRVVDYMTPSAHFVGSEQSLASASERMRRLGIRNLPVIRDGKLCGVLSEHDVALAESLPSVELAQLAVGEAMGRDLYPVAESAPLVHVARTMAAHSYGCAVVMERGAVVGVFATGDALRVLAALLEAERGEPAGMSANETRALVLTEHAHVDALVARTHRAVHRVRSSRDPERDARHVRAHAHHLRDAIRSYLELEQRELAPVLSDLTGSSKTLGQHLGDEHARQIADTAALASVLEDADLAPAALAEQLEHLLGNLERDLERERALLLALDATSNDSVISDAAAD
jgi:acetoin utilization protein AcuB